MVKPLTLTHGTTTHFNSWYNHSLQHIVQPLTLTHGTTTHFNTLYNHSH